VLAQLINYILNLSVLSKMASCDLASTVHALSISPPVISPYVISPHFIDCIVNPSF